MTTTLATIRPKAHGHNDVREMQVRLERGALTVWMNTTRGPVLLRDQGMLDELTAALRRRGLGARQQELEADDAPAVCPDCHAVNEPCAASCPERWRREEDEARRCGEVVDETDWDDEEGDPE